MNKPHDQNGFSEQSVNIDDPRAVHYWATQFGCSDRQLKEAVHQVGRQPEAVRAQLACKMPIAKKTGNR
jgi:hypothetical protein